MESPTESTQDSLDEKLVDKPPKVDNLQNVNREESPLNSKKVTFVQDLKLNTIQNIYDPKTSQTEQRSSSIRNRILKTDYIKLHRQNFVSLRSSSVDKLKGKYESIAKQADNDLKLNTGVRTKVNTDSKFPNKGTCVIISQEDETKSDTSISPTVSIDESQNPFSNSSSSETIVEVKQTDVEKSSNYLTRTTSNIEKLQNNLSSKLSNETIERLKFRYSPASFGYTNKNNLAAKNKNSSEEKLTKIPVPTPRKSSITSDDSKQKIESVTVKLTTVDVPKTCTVKDTITELVTQADEIVSEKDENSNVISEPTVVQEPEPTVSKLDEPTTKPSDPKVDDVTPPTPGELTYSNIKFAEPEDKHFIVRKSSSEDSVDQVENFLSEIIMEKRTKEKKRSNSFKRLAAGIFGREKKKGDGDKLKHKKDNEVFSDNAQNESQAFDRNSSHRHTIDNSFSRLEIQRQNSYPRNSISPSYEQYQKYPNPDDRNLRGRYTEMKGSNISSFRPNRQQFPGEDYVPMTNGNLEKSKNTPTTYMNINKYADTSSSSSNTLDSDRNCTYQNALIAQAEMRQLQHNENMQRMQRNVTNKPSHNSPHNRFVNYDKYQNSPEAFRTTESNNLQLVKPKAHIPINSERPLPNPYHNSHDSPEKYETIESGKTLDRNLNVDHSKTYALKNNLYNPNENANKVNNDGIIVEDVYGTVFDSIVPRNAVKNNPVPQNRITSPDHSINSSSTCSSPTYRSQISPKSLEGTKLKLPSNREKIDLQPRIRSPIPQVKVSTDKIIATELLRNKRSPSRESSSFEEIKPKSSPNPIRNSPKLNSPNHHHNNSLRKQDKQLLDKANSSLRNIDQVDTNSEFVYLNLETPPQKKLSPNQVEWQRKQREVNSSPLMEMSNVTTNALIHANPEERVRRSYDSSPISRQPVQLREGIYGSGKPPSVGSLNSSLSNVRAQTPQQLPPSPTQRSPEKQHIIHNVEAFYWRELKKLKEREEEELAHYRQQQVHMYGYVEDPVIVRRSRSVSPSMRRAQRSLSLPRDGRPNMAQERRVIVQNPRRDNSPMLRPGRQLINGHEVILEGRPLIAKQPIALPADSTYGQVRQPTFQRSPHFVRNTFERSTIGPIGVGKDGRNVYENQNQDSKQLYMPIFKRGSLTNNVNVADSQMSKKVSFSNNANVNDVVPAWPTKNGYTRSPPTRRIERETSMEDDVFLPNSPRLAANTSAMNSSPYSHQEQIYQNQASYYVRPEISAVDYGGRKIQELPQHEIEKLYMRTSPRQITVSNKVCDIYGKIHDEQKRAMANDRALAASRNYGQVKQVGLVYGHLQQTQNPENEVVLRKSYNQLNSPNNNFVRGTRLTASVNDMYKRYPSSDNPQYVMPQRRLNEPIYTSERRGHQAPFRPLPPIPCQQDSRLPLMRKTVRGNSNFSSAESGSESGEVQRIFQSGTKQRNINVIESYSTPNERNAHHVTKSTRGVALEPSGDSTQ